MIAVSRESRTMSYKRNLILGCILLISALICTIMTIIFLYVSNEANRKIAAIREEYRTIAERRETKVEELYTQVAVLQKKLDALPERTATKTVTKVREAVQEDSPK